jgi:hypothetical protein
MEKIICNDRVRNEEVFHRVRKDRNILHTIKKGKLTVLVTSGVGSAFWNTIKGFPLQAWRLRLLDRLDFRHYEGGKVVTLTHRSSLPPGVFLVLIFRV